MTDCAWTHSSEGFSFRISTRKSQLRISGNLPVANMDVRFDRGMNPLPPPPATATPVATAPPVATDVPVPLFVYEPVLITVIVFFAEEGRARYIYNVDSDGNISVAWNAAGLVGPGFQNTAKGLGKGRPQR